jgi:hypothetical protein
MSALKFDWEEVTEEPVLAVVGRSERRRDDGSLVWDALAFKVGAGAVVLTATADTDEIVVAHEPAPEGEEWKSVTALADALGKPLGWCWVGINYRGYCDSFTFALGDVVPDALQPRLAFLAEGAALTCFDLKPRTA